MQINGTAIANRLLENLNQDVLQLKTQGIIPTLAVIQIGNDTASTSYINQKEKAARAVGAKLIHLRQLQNISPLTLQKLIIDLNRDSQIHGLIIQRPVPVGLNDEKLLNLVDPVKDVDGFVPDSKFDPPIALAIMEILKMIIPDQNLSNFLKTRQITVIGRGETGGKPIADYLRKVNCPINIIHHLTTDPAQIISKSDIVISCVGKPQIVKASAVKPGSVLITVGIFKDAHGLLHGDYEEAEIAPIAGYYTPARGGVGPVNVACLMQNLISASQKTA